MANVLYRIIKEGISFGDRSGEAAELADAIEMAKEYAKESGTKFIVEKVERMWPPKLKRKPGDNAIHASIHQEDFYIGFDDD
jgi:hypothetical protein